MINGPNLSPVHIWQVTQADVGKPSQTHQWFTLSELCNALALLHTLADTAGGLNRGRSGSYLTPWKRDQHEASPTPGWASLQKSPFYPDFFLCRPYYLLP